MRPGDKVRVGLGEFFNAESKQAVDNNGLLPLRDVDQLEYRDNRADAVNVLNPRVFRGCVTLGHDAENLRPGDDRIDQFARLVAPHGEWNDGSGKDDRVSNRQDGQKLGDIDRSIGAGQIGRAVGNSADRHVDRI